MATSRRSGQRRDVTERTYANVATFGETSRRSGKRRDVRGNVATFGETSRRSGKRRDVPEIANNQRRDVGCSRRDVPEMVKINVATLESNVATFQRV